MVSKNLQLTQLFPRGGGVDFGIKYQKWKKMEAVVATSWVHALKINSQMGFTKQSNPTSRIKILSFKPCSIILSWIHETKLQSTSLHNFTFIAINYLHRTYDTHTSFSLKLMCRCLDPIGNLCYNDMLIFILTYMIIIAYFTIDIPSFIYYNDIPIQM